MNSCKRKLLYSNNRMKIVLHIVNLPTMSKRQLHFSSKKKKKRKEDKNEERGKKHYNRIIVW